MKDIRAQVCVTFDVEMDDPFPEDSESLLRKMQRIIDRFNISLCTTSHETFAVEKATSAYRERIEQAFSGERNLLERVNGYFANTVMIHHELTVKIHARLEVWYDTVQYRIFDSEGEISMRGFFPIDFPDTLCRLSGLIADEAAQQHTRAMNGDNDG